MIPRTLTGNTDWSCVRAWLVIAAALTAFWALLLWGVAHLVAGVIG